MKKMIIQYVVRKPGQTSWSTHRSLEAARREKRNADRLAGPGHQIYALHPSGDLTTETDRGQEGGMP